MDDIAHDSEGIVAIVSIKYGESNRLSDEVLRTIGFFRGLAIDVPVTSLPLHVHMIDKSTKNLSIYPNAGSIVLADSRLSLQMTSGNDYHLTIHKYPSE